MTGSSRIEAGARDEADCCEHIMNIGYKALHPLQFRLIRTDFEMIFGDPQIGAFLADHGDIVCHTAEFSVMSHKSVESLWLICHKLDMQPAFLTFNI